MATLSEEVRTLFTGNVTDLVQKTEQAKKAVTGLRTAYSQQAGNVKGSLLNPGSLANKGIEKLAGSLKLSGTAVGIAAAGATVLVKTFQAANRLAGEQADKMHALNESMRVASRTNLFASSLDGTSSLVERMKGTRDMIREAEQAQRDANPYGFGHGVVGNMRNVMANKLAGAQNALGLGPYNNFDREKDEAATLEMQKRIAAQSGARLQREATRGLRDQLGLTQNQLSGSTFDSRIQGLHRARRGELQGIKGTELYTDENRRNIRLRYKEQILAERELQGFSELRHKRAMEEEGIQRRLVMEEEKRVLTLQKELEGTREQLQTGTHLTTEMRQALEEQREQQRTALSMAKADLTAAQAQHKLAEDTVAIQARNTTATAKTYQTELATVGALRAQIAAMKDLNTTKTEGLQITLAESENRIRQLRQNTMYGKTGGQIEQRMQHERTDRAKRDQFDKRMDRTAGGLIRPDKDMAGNIIGGIDPITGEYRVAAPGTGLAERGLSTGSLSDRATRVGGGPSLTRDRDPNGGLSTPGTTPSMFERTSAAEYLAGKQSVGDILASHRGDPAHDPAARLRDAPIFRDFSKGDRDTLTGARSALTTGDRMAHNTASSFIAATAPHFKAPNTLSQAAIQIQSKQLSTQEAIHGSIGQLNKNMQILLDNIEFK